MLLRITKVLLEPTVIFKWGVLLRAHSALALLVLVKQDRMRLLPEVNGVIVLVYLT